MSLVDAFRNFLSSLQPDQRHNLNLRSCEACSFHKVLNRTHYCTQVQPASTINNVYDAQLCIYYTPEQTTTGAITQSQRESQASRLDYIQKIYEIVKIDELPNPNLLRNPSFEDGLKLWQTANAQITAGFLSGSALRIGDGSGSGSAYQYVRSVRTDDVPFFVFRYRSNTADAAIALAVVGFSDGTTQNISLNGTSNAWSLKVVDSFTGAKYVAYVSFIVNAPYIVDFDECDLFLTRMNPNEDGVVTHFSKTATGDVKAPATGKALKVLGFFFYSTADITAELRFKTSTNVVGALPVKGACGMNLLAITKPQGASNEVIEIYLSGAGTVKGWVCTKDV